MFWKSKETPVRPCVAAVIPAAGSSTRMGTNKLLLPLGDLPVLAHTLLAFEQCALIDEIIVVCRETDIVPYGNLAQNFGCTKVKHILRGGDTRTQSVLAGLSACSDDIQFVAIHDGARPLIGQEIIVQTISAALESGAAAPVVAMKDSIKRIAQGKILSDVPRDSIAAVQTPQVFRRTLILSALKEALASGVTLTDDCAAVERIGVSVTATQGSYRNLKITTPEDIPMALALLEQEEGTPCVSDTDMMCTN